MRTTETHVSRVAGEGRNLLPRVRAGGVTVREPIPLFALGAVPGEDNRVSSNASSSFPTLTPYIPAFTTAGTGDTAIVVASGGAFKWLGPQESGDAALWLAQAVGITTFTLKYRTPWMSSRLPWVLAPLIDTQRALGLVRYHARRFGVNASRVGMLGFSAGGLQRRWARAAMRTLGRRAR